MEVLKELTPEQISALSPECLQLILSTSTRDKDILKLKERFSKVTLSLGGSYDSTMSNTMNCVSRDIIKKMSSDKNINKIKTLLSKYDKEHFYVTYGENYNNVTPQLHTLDEINKILPTGINLEKLCFDSGPIVKLIYPVGFNMIPTNAGEIAYVAQLPFLHPNLHFVHPQVYNVACHLMGQ